MQEMTERILKWYRATRVPYPWRMTRDPYRIWLSEILLQQTRISVVIPFYESITRKFPRLSDLAEADAAEFLAAWSGIGYYRRAQNMLSCAREVQSKHGGKFPSQLSELLALPGIGKYTAGALRNLCFGILTPAIDGNVTRVLARITNRREMIHTPKFQTKIAESFLDFGQDAPASEYFQSLMELGEQVCLPKPRCSDCPVQTDCLSFKAGCSSKIPRMPKLRPKETFHWYFLILRSAGRLYFAQNHDRPFLKQAWMPPDHLASKPIPKSRLSQEFKKAWGFHFKDFSEVHSFRHSVTYRDLQVHVLMPKSVRPFRRRGKFLDPRKIDSLPTSSVTHKILRSLNVEALKRGLKPANSDAG
jgi:A/G-specific adenine glycosylase